MIDGAFYVEGKVVLCYYQPIPKLIKVGDKNFFFDAKHGVSLSLVDEEDAPALLGVMGGCCGGKRLVISLASEGVYKHWLDGQGGR